MQSWNYVSVQARGLSSTVTDDTKKREIIEEVVAATNEARARYKGVPAQFQAPWSTASLDPMALSLQLERLGFFELRVGTLEGKFKLSQNLTAAERDMVVAALLAGAGGEEGKVLGKVMREHLAAHPPPESEPEWKDQPNYSSKIMHH